MADRFWDRLNKITQKYRQNQQSGGRVPSRAVPGEILGPRSIMRTAPVVPVEKPSQAEPTGPLTIADKEALIREAGKKLVLVELVYKGELRMVEPYSFKNGIYGRYFYGRALDGTDGRTLGIRSFRMDRIGRVRITDTPYVPVWEVFPPYLEDSYK